MYSYEFTKKVVECYEKGQGIFANKVNAEELVPTTLPNLEKALYIFYVLQLDYAMKSQRLYSGATQLTSQIPSFFTPTHLISLSDEDLLNYLKTYLHPRYINEALRRYRFNTIVLLNSFNGDPRNIFLNKTSVMDVLTEIKKLRGFGPKIGNFFARTMINTFNYKYTDIDQMLPPVDVHDVHIAYLLGYTTTPEMTKKNIDFVKNLWSKACIESNISWLVFDKALWLLGSEGKPRTANDIDKLLF